MARKEKTVFISYRRTDLYKALAVYQDLTGRGYDVFLDYTSIHAGDFEQIIVSNIKARAHFLLILTPTALDGCSKPDDWLRREVETAIEEKRNIVPLFFDEFSFSSPSVAEKLTGNLANVKRFNGLKIPSEYFTEAMDRLSENFLSDPFDVVIHPISTAVLKVVREEQSAANKALAGQTVGKGGSVQPKPNLRPYGIGAAVLLVGALVFFGAMTILRNLGSKETPTPVQVTEPPPTAEVTVAPSMTVTAAPTDTETPVPPTPEVGPDGSLVSPKDNMLLVLVPAGDFSMGTTGNEEDERPVHTVSLDAFYIDKTEVTNAMYALCVADGRCEEPRAITSITRNEQTDNFYYGNPVFDDYPVIFVSWNDAQAYCRWADRRLPTEAEWEKAASWDDRQKTKRVYPWGNKIDCSYANYYGNGAKLCVGDTTAVGSYPAGASFYGILDMAGNVWEWVADRYDPEYYGVKSDYDNPTGPGSGDYILIRGGSFLTGRSVGIRSSDREIMLPDTASQGVGFRCAMDASE